uniref:Retrotransposon protein, putative, Ty1-copia subclass n=1 Tax=Oryza sativa subsp. japonica TaxID=39947 RepID=Q2QN44_ORYSJ|nr:retrotransposon protein, putative, Ty1-copia subclass [Oryza sativa Japonica Group]
MAGFADALRPDKFTGILTADQQKQFDEATTLFVGCNLSVLGDCLVEVYMHMTDAKELWNALNTKFGATDASNDLYIMEQFHNYKMADNHSVVEHTHEIQFMAKELLQPSRKYAAAQNSQARARQISARLHVYM